MTTINFDPFEPIEETQTKVQERGYYKDGFYKVTCTGYSIIYAVLFNPETKEIKKVLESDSDDFRNDNAELMNLNCNNGNIYEKYLDTLKRIRKGCIVEVVRGRKVPHGIIGKVFYMKEMSFNYGHKTTVKVGIKDNQDNVYWTYENNLEFLKGITEQ